MTLLLDAIEVLETTGDPAAIEVHGVEHDSRRVSVGDLFCCLPGHRADGHDHALEAIELGAVGILCERLVDSVPEGIVQARVAQGSVRPAMARVAATYWGDPARSLLMAGVTGTNGKTTVTQLLGAVLNHAGHPTTVIGTLSGARTTPEATELQRSLAGVRDAHLGFPPCPGSLEPVASRPAVAMEVSSHALVQSRVDSIRFDVAVFTNLSHEHLDFHHTMEEYFEAKALLFQPDRAKAAVVYADDSWGRRLLERITLPVTEVHDDAASDVRLSVGRSSFTWRGLEISLPLTGTMNVRNAILAAEAAVVLGVPPDVVAEGLGVASPVPGRMETVQIAGYGAADIDVLVDFAHTPAALEAMLIDVGQIVRARGRRAIVVFGCGGDRDASKRPLMGAIASRLADVAVITSDNPRSENPGAIIAEVTSGIPADSAATVVLEPERGAAIDLAVRTAHAGDVVILAGKGHETTQTVGEREFPFDDREVAVAALARRALAAGGGSLDTGTLDTRTGR